MQSYKLNREELLTLPDRVWEWRHEPSGTTRRAVMAKRRPNERTILFFSMNGTLVTSSYGESYLDGSESEKVSYMLWRNNAKVD